jgi:exodeoxyribonuclease V alpha subunit
LRTSPLVGLRERDRPLICDHRGRIYLQRLYRHEQWLAHALARKAEIDTPTLSPSQRQQLQALLAHYFGPPASRGVLDWQKIAAAVAWAKKLCIISGAPGTGKTTTVAKIIAVLLEMQMHGSLRIHLCAPTGKAAARLAASLANASRTLDCPAAVAAALQTLAPCTIHRLLKFQPGDKGFFFHEGNPLPSDLVIVDEASMVDLVMMSRLVKAIPEEARLIILGDKDQLASVDAGSVFGDLCRNVHAQGYSPAMQQLIVSLTQAPLTIDPDHQAGRTRLQDCIVVLRENFRFDPKDGIGALAQAVNCGNSLGAKRILSADRSPTIRWERWRQRTEVHKLIAAYALKGYEGYLACADVEEALAHFNRFMILSALTSGPLGVAGLNRTAADVLRKARWIDRARPWYRGRPVMITRNSYRMGLFNGDIGLTWPDSEGRLKVWFQGEGGDLRPISPQRLPDHQTVFAMTVHKSQGSEFDRLLMILPDRDAPVLSRELVYTGCSRARRQLVLIAREDVLDLSLSRTVHRTSGLFDALQADIDGEPEP